jgi:hypothetical protein
MDARSLILRSLPQPCLTFLWLVIVRIPLIHAHTHPYVNDPSATGTDMIELQDDEYERDKERSIASEKRASAGSVWQHKLLQFTTTKLKE